MRRSALTVVLILTLALASSALAAVSYPGLSLLAIWPLNAGGNAEGVMTFSQVPTADQIAAISGLGLRVQAMKKLPLALAIGPRSAMVAAVQQGLANDVYPNERLKYYSVASNATMRVNEVQSAGVDGTGVLVAVVDSGVDATHPDLAKRMARNIKMVVADAGVSGVPSQTIVIPVDQTPYNDSDTSSGHGTHVAGIIAADNTDGKVLGVAPGAKLVGYGMGDAVFVFSAVTAYDDILANLDTWPVRVVNCSFGSAFRLYDPNDPINIASKAMHDAGIAVVFAAGNETTEMAINPNSIAPWVISAAAGTYNHQRAEFSSGGIQYDNSTIVQLPATDEIHLSFSGDRMGLYHPSVTAPGDNIVSTATTGAAVTGTPGGTATASGTSMAAPAISGVCALLIQKSPSITPDQIKSVLEVTSTLMPSVADPSAVEPFYRSGYGYVDAKAAIDLVSRTRYLRDHGKALGRLHADIEKRVMNDRDYKVVKSDFWTFSAAPATVNGTPDTKTYTVNVPSTTSAIAGIVAYPSLGYVGVNEFDYEITLTDAAGKVVATSTPSSVTGMSQLFVDLTKGSYTYGNWTIGIVGNLGAQDQDTLMGIRVSAVVSQLTPQTRIRPVLPSFTATGTQPNYFQRGTAGLLTSPEGCNLQAGAPVGGLAGSTSGGACQSGSMGYLVNYGAGAPAIFTGPKLTAPLTIGGTATAKVYLVDPLQPAWASGFNPRLAIELDAVDDSDNLVMAIASYEQTVCNDAGACNVGPQPVSGTYTFNVPPVTIPAGTHLSVVLRESAAVASGSRIVFGGAGLATNYADSGVTLTTGTMK